jgi:hypothetical protein
MAAPVELRIVPCMLRVAWADVSKTSATIKQRRSKILDFMMGK